MKNKHKYARPIVEIIEFSDEEVVMNLVASSDGIIIPPNEQPPVIGPVPPGAPPVTPPQPPVIPPHGDVYDDFE